MWTSIPDPQDALRSGSVAATAQPRSPVYAEPFDPEAEGGFGDAFAAAFYRENILFSGADDIRFSDEATDADRAHARQNADWNPYRYMRENYDEGVLEALKPYISEGEFETVYSPRQLNAVAAQLMHERGLIEKMEGSFAGALLGSIVTAAFDPTSYVPYAGIAGKALRLSHLGGVSKVGMDAIGSAAAAEVGLQATQRLREVEESIMNIGTSAMLGGGLGVFAPATRFSHPLHPRNADNPLRRENLRSHGEIVQQAGSTRRDVLSADEISQLRTDHEGMVLAEADSMGAARVPGTEEVSGRIWRRDYQDLSLAGKGVRKLGEALNSKTIVGRVARASSPQARAIGQRLMDFGGILTESHIAGRGVDPAEAIKQNLMVEVENLFTSFRKQLADLNAKIADTGRRVSEDDVMSATQRILVGAEDQEIWSRLTAQYGDEVTQEIGRVARQNAEDIHSLNDVYEKRLVAEGILQDAERVSRLETELKARRAERDRLKEELKQAKEAEGEVDTADTEQRLTRARKMVEDTRKDLSSERRKAVPMGREYGHAQMWNQDALIEDPEGFKLFLIDALVAKPDGEWLEEISSEIDELSEMFPDGMTPDDLEELRVKDRSLYDRVITEWAGDAWYFELSRLEKHLEQARKLEEEATLDLMEATRSIGQMGREETALKLSEAKKRRGRYEAKLNEQRAKTEKLRQEARQAKRLELEQMTTRQRGQLDEISLNLRRSEKTLEKMEGRARKLDTAMREVEQRQAALKDLRKRSKDALADLKENRGIAAKDLRSAKRKLAKHRKATPLDELVDEVYANLSQMGGVPSGILDRIARESDRTTGRVKDRIIRLDKRQRLEGIEKGWLRADLPQILFGQYDQLASELSLREALSIGPNRKYGSWGEIVRSVEEEYDQMIADATERPVIDDLKKQRKVIVDDLVEARDRIRGQILKTDGTSYGWANWLSSKLRAANFTRFGGGFLLSSLTDMGTVALRHGSPWRLMSQYGRRAIREGWRFHHENPSEFELFVNSMEIGMGAAAHARRFGSDDLVAGPYASRGIGTGRTKRTTGAIDNWSEWTSEKVAQFSGLPYWNRMWKIAAAHSMAVKVRDMTGRYDKLTDVERGDLASLGIGKTEADQLNRFIRKHGHMDEEGHFDPGLEKWSQEAGGEQAARKFRMAIQRDMNRAINTPGVGDTPRLMSTWWGRLWLQFQTFAFTFLNRYAFPAVQRASRGGDMQAINSFAYILGGATMVMVSKDIINGRDPSERFTEENAEQTIHEIIDRTGMLGWTSPYVDSALKATSGLTGYSGTNRYARNHALTSTLGVNFGLFMDISKASAAVGSAEPDVAQKVAVLTPLNTWTRLLSNFTDD